MRTLLLIAAILGVVSPAGAATRNFGITSFTKIRVSGPYRVSIATGIAPFAKATGSPAAIDRVQIEVRGDTLVVQSNSSWGGYPGTDPGPVEVSVGTHELNNASLIGSGSVAIDRIKGLSFALTIQGSGAGEVGNAAIDQMSVSLEGTANAKLAGKAGKVTALVRGVSTLDAAKLTTPSADFSVDGTATVDANVTDTAKVNGWGPATVRLSGRPACNLKVQGSTTVSGCR
jgi:Putative auto-transporter adhesin, head GIN domain